MKTVYRPAADLARISAFGQVANRNLPSSHAVTAPPSRRRTFEYGDALCGVGTDPRLLHHNDWSLNIRQLTECQQYGEARRCTSPSWT